MAQASDHHDHLEVDSDRQINGMLRAGATVRGGSVLSVAGIVTGDVVVESDSALKVEGILNPTTLQNRGALWISGVAEVDFRGAGVLMASPGTIFSSFSPPLRLQEDGSLVEDRGGNTEQYNGSKVFVWSHRTEGFVLLPEEDHRPG